MRRLISHARHIAEVHIHHCITSLECFGDVASALLRDASYDFCVV